MVLDILAGALLLSLNSHAAESKIPERELIRVGDTRLRVQVGRTLESQRQGLMFRKELRDGDGMLFVYEKETPLIFWMKNTLIPLDIGFFGSDRKLREIKSMEVDPEGVDDSLRRRYESAKPGMYALEVPRGWFARKKIRLGAKLELGKVPDAKKSTLPRTR